MMEPILLKKATLFMKRKQVQVKDVYMVCLFCICYVYMFMFMVCMSIIQEDLQKILNQQNL